MKQYEDEQLTEAEAALNAFAFRFAMLWDNECRIYDVNYIDDIVRCVKHMYWTSAEARDAALTFTKLTVDEQRTVLREISGTEVEVPAASLFVFEDRAAID